MIGWFVEALRRFVELGLRLAGALIAGILGGLVGGGARRGVRVRGARGDEVVDVRHQVLREGLPRATALFPGDDADTTRHWVAEVDGRVVGVVTVLASPMPDPPADARPAPALQLRGMAVLPEHRGQDLGERLLDAAEASGAPMWCNARTGVVGFYARHGWRAVGATFDVPHAGPHQRMWWPGRATAAGS